MLWVCICLLGIRSKLEKQTFTNRYCVEYVNLRLYFETIYFLNYIVIFGEIV